MVELNDGHVIFYCKKQGQTGGGSPVERLGPLRTAWYGDLGIDANSFNSTQQDGVEFIRRIRVLQDKEICSLHVAVIDDVQYEIGRAWSGREQKTGVPVTDITLKRVEKDYEFNRIL